jgi:hypothetical protein
MNISNNQSKKVKPFLYVYTGGCGVLISKKKEDHDKERDQPHPIIDDLTVKMFNAFSHHTLEGALTGETFMNRTFFKGVHYCACGAQSSNRDYLLGEPLDLVTNSLCVHYLAFHRTLIKEDELKIVESFSLPDEDVTQKNEFVIMLDPRR